jgi:hypothetical protein
MAGHKSTQGEVRVGFIVSILFTGAVERLPHLNSKQMRLTKEQKMHFLRNKKWTTVLKLMNEGEEVWPLKIKPSSWRSIRSVCERLNEQADSKHTYEIHYKQGEVTIIKRRKDEESCGERMQTE